MVQWLRLCTSNAEGTSSIPGGGTKIPHAVVQKKKKRFFSRTKEARGSSCSLIMMGDYRETEYRKQDLKDKCIKNNYKCVLGHKMNKDLICNVNNKNEAQSFIGIVFLHVTEVKLVSIQITGLYLQEVICNLHGNQRQNSNK